MSRLDEIFCEQDNLTLVTRTEVEDFYAKSVLIVNDSQEAIFYKDGQALDLFQGGRHQLETENLPIFKKLFSKLFNHNRTPFPWCVVFINKVCVLDMAWGTDAPITVEDPKYHRIINLRSNGQLALKVADSRKFVVKIVGQLREFGADEVKKAIKALLMAYVKSSISSSITQHGTTILEINNELPIISDLVKVNVNARLLDELGIELENFYIGAIIPDDNDMMVLRQAKDREQDLLMEAEAKRLASMKETEAEAYRQQQLGYSFQEKQTYDVLKTAAGNEATGGAIMNAGVGLGMGVGMAHSFGGMVNNMNNAAQQPQGQGQPQGGQPAPQQAAMPCPQCGAPLPPGAKFCANCGAKVELPQAKFCPQCGNKIEGDAKFCPNCGQKLG